MKKRIRNKYQCFEFPIPTPNLNTCYMNPNSMNGQEYTQILKEGYNGKKVKELQHLLQKLNYFNEAADGSFTISTKKAVLAFQGDHQLLTDGVVGDKTWKMIGEAFTSPTIPYKPTQSLSAKEEIGTLPTMTEYLAEPKIKNVDIGNKNLSTSYSQKEDSNPMAEFLFTSKEENGQTENYKKKSGPITISDNSEDLAIHPIKYVNNESVDLSVPAPVIETLEQTADSLPLSQGDTGEDVMILQERLKIAGFFPGSVTGSFGPETTEAVQGFQVSKQLQPTGIVDQATWSALSRATYVIPKLSKAVTRPTLRLGDTGNYVTLLQQQLQQLMFYQGNITGSFDTQTQFAVKAFQTNNRLTADGIVGRNTWSALQYLYSPLTICGGEITPELPKPEPEPSIPEIPTEENATYIVQKGDSLYAIARRFNTTVEEIKALNNLMSDALSIGQQLRIPAATQTPNTSIYTVQRGDTLYAIARKFNTTVEEIKALNNLMSNALSIGQQLRIPNATQTPDTFIYTVQRGDTLYALANRYNTTVDTIKRLNNLTSNNLSIGQQLVIPITSKETSTFLYNVQRGDSLYSIANRFDTTVETLRELNNLNSDLLMIGQELMIPTQQNQETSTFTYTVKRGDNLFSIANRFNTTVATIKRINNLSSDLLSIEQELQIPR